MIAILRDRHLSAIVVSMLLVTGVFSVTTDALADWPMFRADAARSGGAPGVELSDLAVVWAAELGGSVDSSPAVVGGRVYVGNSLGHMTAISPTDGAIIWRFETNGAVVSSPSVVDGICIFGSVDGFVYALDASTGAMRWCYRTRGPVISSPAVVDGRVVFGSIDGRLYALSLSDGSLLWRTGAGAAIQASPTVAEGLVLYGDDDAHLRALNLSDGALVWEYQGSGKLVAAPAVGTDVAVFGVMGPSALRPPKLEYLIALRLQTGERLWAIEEAYSVLSAPLVHDGRVYFVTVEGYVSKTTARAASLADGSALWDRVLPGVVDSSMALVGANLCFGCHDGRLYLLAAESGEIVDAESLAPKIFSSPAISDGRVYIGASDGRLYCLEQP
ncbi:MAG: PQQ-binding-like beta-propeller repeat protein [candidate division WS1 bacterium]|nr:PQQ-binding-like beta-propeller repeat protein [candidate division WS1 bacterium]